MQRKVQAAGPPPASLHIDGKAAERMPPVPFRQISGVFGRVKHAAASIADPVT